MTGFKMYYRFQKTQGVETSMHVYPTWDILDLYANYDAVEKMLKRIDSGEVPDWDVANYDKIDNYFLKPGYVCCNQFAYGDDELTDVKEFASAPAAYEDYVVVFDTDLPDHRIFDGFIAKMDDIVAVYKNENRIYKRIK